MTPAQNLALIADSLRRSASDAKRAVNRSKRWESKLRAQGRAEAYAVAARKLKSFLVAEK